MLSREEKFTGRAITNIYKCRARKGSYAFFQAADERTSTRTGHSWYGNVKFVVPISDILNIVDLNYYYIDTHYFKTVATTRVILTRKQNQPEGTKNKNFQLFSEDLKHLFYFEENKLFYRTWYKIKAGEYLRHILHFILDCDSLDTHDLFQKSVKFPVDHSEANRKTVNNRFDNGICLIYNGQGNPCPSPYNEDETRDTIQKEAEFSLGHWKDLQQIFRSQNFK